MTLRDRLGFCPAQAATSERRLDVGHGHVVYVEECGNPKGQAVLIVHGGPGGGCNPTMRRLHDPFCVIQPRNGYYYVQSVGIQTTIYAHNAWLTANVRNLLSK